MKTSGDGGVAASGGESTPGRASRPMRLRYRESRIRTLIRPTLQLGLKGTEERKVEGGRAVP